MIVCPCHHGMARPQVAANKLSKLSQTANKEWSSSLGLGEALTTPPHEKQNVMKYS